MISRKNLIVGDTIRYAFSNYIAQGIGMINSFLLRGFMGPAGMGVWSVIQVILGYCGYASLGTTRALGRDYPILRGKGDFEQAEHCKNSTLTFSMVVSFVPSLGLLGWALWKHNSLETSFRIGVLFLCVFLFAQRFYDFLITILRSERKFKILSGQVVLNAVGGLTITILLVQPWKIYGLYAGTAILTVLLTWYLLATHSCRLKVELHKETIVKELKAGLPLVASGFLYTLLIGLDKLIVAKQLGFQEVGLYSIAMMVSNYILALPMMFSNVLYPNLLEHYGEHQEDPVKVINYLTKPVFALSILVPFLCGMTFAFMPVLVQLFIPKFIGGLACMNIYLIGAFFLLIGQFSNNFLITIDKYLRTIPVLGAALAINFFANQACIAAGWGVNGVALGTVMSFAFYGLLAYFLALREVLGASETFRRIAIDLLVFGSFLGMIFVVDLNVIGSSIIYVALFKGALFLLISAPYLIYIEKKERLLTTLKEIFVKKFFSNEKNHAASI